MIGSLSDASRTTARQPHDENHYTNPKTGLGKKCYARQTPRNPGSCCRTTLANRASFSGSQRRMRSGSLRGSQLAWLVSPHHTCHVGLCCTGHVAVQRRKKLPSGRFRSAYRSYATCSHTCSGVDGTALSICCTGRAGAENINSTRSDTTTKSADRPCLYSIYNCSTKPLRKLSISLVSLNEWQIRRDFAGRPKPIIKLRIR